MDAKEREYKTFKLFYNGKNKESLQELEDMLVKNKIINKRLIAVIKEGKKARSFKSEMLNNRIEYSEIMYYYDIVLKKISSLAKELNLESSLELNILFTYLLWNGYLSKNKTYTFDSNNIRRIPGFFFADIMDGRGVCLNNSDMLKDVLNINGYNSSIIQNHFPSKVSIDYEVPIKRVLIDTTSSRRILPVIKPNHTFNLIEDNNQLYIYDSTNCILERLNSPYKSSVINGTGNFKLFPYGSYSLCTTFNETELLDKLLTGDNYNSPYIKEDFISTSEVSMEVLKANVYLLEEFYKEVKEYITKISEETSKIKIKSI